MTRQAVAVRQPPPYRDGNVLRWLAGFGVSLLGDQVYFVALAWTAAEVAGAGGAGLVLATASVSRLVLLLVGGAVVDRWGARRLMLGSDALRCAVMAAAAVVTATTEPALAVLIVVALVFGAVDAVFLPAVGALPPYLVASEHLARLQGMRIALARGAIVAGAPLGGAVVAAYGIAAAFAVNAFTFAVSVLALATVRLRAGAPATPTGGSGRARGMGAEVRAGLSVAVRSPLLRTILLVSAVAELGFTGPFNVGIALLAQERGWGAAGVGLIVGGFGVGAALAAVAVAVLGRIPRAGLLVGPLAVVTGGALAGIGSAPARLWAVATSVLLGVSVGLAGALGTALLQAHTPPQYLGRVMSLSSLAGFGGIPVSYALTGLVAGLWGTTAAFLGGTAIAAAAGLAALSSRALRRAELSASR
ncbi:MFS transporter [Salinispora arenicola]|uniref:MFS transporter n=1 Tax=Salinispora arenicola TaxID=168697 RepID=UPI00037A05FC|nr:MFS transporter [Salinispora arenicola]